MLLVTMTNPSRQGLALLTAAGTRPDTGEYTGQACSVMNGCLVLSGRAAAAAAAPPYGMPGRFSQFFQSWAGLVHLLPAVSFSDGGLLPGLTAVA